MWVVCLGCDGGDSGGCWKKKNATASCKELKQNKLLEKSNLTSRCGGRSCERRSMGHSSLMWCEDFQSLTYHMKGGNKGGKQWFFSLSILLYFLLMSLWQCKSPITRSESPSWHLQMSCFVWPKLQNPNILNLKCHKNTETLQNLIFEKLESKQVGWNSTRGNQTVCNKRFSVVRVSTLHLRRNRIQQQPWQQFPKIFFKPSAPSFTSDLQSTTKII